MTELEQNTITLATKVMGWKLHVGRTGELISFSSDEEPERFHWNPFDYIADAWMLIDKLRNSRKWCYLLLDSDYNFVWEVKLQSHVGDHDPNKPTVRSGCHESICEAICAAALKTIEP